MFIITVSLIHFFPLIPFPYYCGCSFYWISGVDNGNIGFPWLILILLPFIYWIAEIEPNTITGVSLLFILLFVVLFLCFPLISFSLFFVVYECFITPLSFILFLFLPSSHRIRTAFISSLFTTFGSISLILSLMAVSHVSPIIRNEIIQCNWYSSFWSHGFRLFGYWISSSHPASSMGYWMLLV